MTVQTLMNKAVTLIGDYENIANYTTSYLQNVTIVVGELMTLGIGITPVKYAVSIDGTYTPAYTPTDTTRKPVLLPTDLSLKTQIKSIKMDSYEPDYYFSVEANSGNNYLLIDVDYQGDISLWYVPVQPEIATMSDVLPISDEAVNSVACHGLAYYLSITDARNLMDNMKQNYELAKRAWRQPKIDAPRKIKYVYDIS